MKHPRPIPARALADGLRICYRTPPPQPPRPEPEPMSPEAHRLFGLACARVASRGRPLRMDQLRAARELACALASGDPGRRNALDPDLGVLGLGWSEVLEVVGEAGLEITWRVGE